MGGRVRGGLGVLGCVRRLVQVLGRGGRFLGEEGGGR